MNKTPAPKFNQAPPDQAPSESLPSSPELPLPELEPAGETSLRKVDQDRGNKVATAEAELSAAERERLLKRKAELETRLQAAGVELEEVGVTNNVYINTEQTSEDVVSSLIEESWKKNREEILGIIQPIVERISVNDLKPALHAYGLSPKSGDQTLANILSEVLEIQPPKIIEDVSIACNGCYNPRSNQITINRAELKENLHELDEDDGVMEHELGTIAHEMWHAYQVGCIKKNSPRSSLYKDSLSIHKYKEGTDQNDDEFWSQVVELEAECFGSIIRKKLEAISKRYR